MLKTANNKDQIDINTCHFETIKPLLQTQFAHLSSRLKKNSYSLLYIGNSTVMWAEVGYDDVTTRRFSIFVYIINVKNGTFIIKLIIYNKEMPLSYLNL